MKRAKRNKTKEKGRIKRVWIMSLGVIFITSFAASYVLINRDTSKSGKLEAKAKEDKESDAVKEDPVIEFSKEEEKKELEVEENVVPESSEVREVPKVVPQVVPTVRPVDNTKPIKKPIEKPKVCGFQGCKLELGHNRPGHEDPVQNWCLFEGCDLLEGQDYHTHDSVVEPPLDLEENDCEYPDCELPQGHVPEHEEQNSDDIENNNN